MVAGFVFYDAFVNIEYIGAYLLTYSFVITRIASLASTKGKLVVQCKPTCYCHVFNNPPNI